MGTYQSVLPDRCTYGQLSGQQYIILESFCPYWQGITKSFDFLVAVCGQFVKYDFASHSVNIYMNKNSPNFIYFIRLLFIPDSNDQADGELLLKGHFSDH